MYSPYCIWDRHHMWSQLFQIKQEQNKYILSKLKVTQLDMLCQLLNVKFMVKVAWEQVWAPDKNHNRDQIWVSHGLPTVTWPLPQPDTLPWSCVVWSQRPRDLTLDGPGCKPWQSFISYLGGGEHNLTTEQASPLVK